MVILFFTLTFTLTYADQGCFFDGKMYSSGEQVVIRHCLGAMKCLGNNAYGDLQQWGGICPDKRSEEGQRGCWFDGRVYQKNEKVVFKGCLGEMICLGNNAYSNITPLYGDCSNAQQKRNVDGQSGCLFDGRVYAPGEDITIKPCLGKMECLGRNNLGPIKQLYGTCEEKRSSNGQDGCYFDGRIYNMGESIQIVGTSAKLLCMGHNIYKEL